MFDKIILRAFGYLLRPVRVCSEAWLLCVVICSVVQFIYMLPIKAKCSIIVMSLYMVLNVIFIQLTPVIVNSQGTVQSGSL